MSWQERKLDKEGPNAGENNARLEMKE